MDAKLILAMPLLTALSFCQTVPGGTLCSIGPFITDPGATTRLTRAEKEYQVTLNNAGQQLCGWQPPQK